MALNLQINPTTGKLDLVDVATGAGIDHGLLTGLGDDDHTQYLLIDGSRDMTGTLLPNANATLDLGDSTDGWRTLYLDNDGGNVVVCPRTVTSGVATDYTFQCGGGSIGVEINQGGTFTFKMDNVGVSGGTSQNKFIIDLGQPDVFQAGTENQFIIQSFNGIATYGFVSGFSGWNGGEYGFALERLSGSEIPGRRLFFDNRIPVSHLSRTVDFRIAGVNKLRINNNGTLDIGSGASRSYNLNASTLTLGGSLNLDIWTMTGQTGNHNAVAQLTANGTAPNSSIIALNGSGAAMDMSIVGTTAYLVCYRGFGGTSTPDTLVIGDSIGAAGLGTANALDQIIFNFRNAEEMRIQQDLITFNNGAVDTQIDWGTSGELGFQVATNDIIRISATQATVYQDVEMQEDTFWTSDGSGVPFGHMYTNTTIAVTISDNNPTEVGDTWTTGEVNLVTFGSSHYLTVTKAGRYRITWTMSIAQNTPGGAIQCEQGIMINGTAQNEGQAHRTIANNNDIGASAGTAILDLAASDQISLFVENQSSTTNIDVEHANVSVTMVGGT